MTTFAADPIGVVVLCVMCAAGFVSSTSSSKTANAPHSHSPAHSHSRSNDSQFLLSLCVLLLLTLVLFFITWLLDVHWARTPRKQSEL
jgi:cell division protein FtsW (lipid II flippase)